MREKQALTLLILSLLAVASIQAVVPGTASGYTSHAPIYISGDSGFTYSNGVTGGSGISSDPYIIEGWDIDATTANGIEIRNTNAYFTIRNVQVHSGGLIRTGIFLGSANNGVIQDAFVYGNYRGIFIWLSSRITVWGGKAYSNTAEGISLLSSSQTSVASLNMSSNGRDGIRIFSSTLVTMTGNNISSNQANGVNLFDSSNVTITVNTVTRNSQTGIALASAVDNKIYHNDLSDNGEQAYDDLASENAWDAGYPSGGNLWSGYVGQDACNGVDQNVCTGPDGIGDVPYLIDSDSQDRYPLMVSYRDTLQPTWSPGSYVTANQIGSTTVTLVWTSAADDVMVLGYRVYQGSSLITVLPSTLQTYTVTGLTPATTYTFRVEAGDEVNNWSQTGPSTVVTTTSGISSVGGGGGRFFPV